MFVLLKQHSLVFVVGAVCVVVNRQGIGPLWYTGVVLIVTGLLMQWALVRRQRPCGDQAPVRLPVPVMGRLTALNGPGTKVPSHTHSHAQTYAVDMKYVPTAEEGKPDPAPPPVWVWPPVRRPRGYPTFGRPVLAPADGTVVTTAGRQRDHLTRLSLPGLAYLYAEGYLRGLGWPRHLLGNYVVLDIGGGVYAVFAHLRRDSLTVKAGDRVAAGQQFAECGNSGNSSDPHLHFQLMDGPDPRAARGMPFEWRYRDDDGEEHVGVPEDLTHFTPVPEARRQGRRPGRGQPGSP